MGNKKSKKDDVVLKEEDKKTNILRDNTSFNFDLMEERNCQDEKINDDAHAKNEHEHENSIILSRKRRYIQSVRNNTISEKANDKHKIDLVEEHIQQKERPLSEEIIEVNMIGVQKDSLHVDSMDNTKMDIEVNDKAVSDLFTNKYCGSSRDSLDTGAVWLAAAAGEKSGPCAAHPKIDFVDRSKSTGVASKIHLKLPNMERTTSEGQILKKRNEIREEKARRDRLTPQHLGHIEIDLELQCDNSSSDDDDGSCSSDNDSVYSSSEDDDDNEVIDDDWLETQEVHITETTLVDVEEEVVLSQYLHEHRALFHVMSQVPLFTTLSELQQEEVLRSLKAQCFNDGESIVRQGEAGDRFYMIVKGQAVVVKSCMDASGVCSEVMQTYLSAGHYFGELSLLYGDARSATVRAVGNDTKVMFLAKKDFDRIEQVHVSLLLKQVPFLSTLNGRDQDALLRRFQSRTYAANEMIVQQGDPGDGLYIITKGEAVVSETVPGEGSQAGIFVSSELTRLYDGHMFGEMSLVTEECRMATVVAVCAVKCLFLTKTDFELTMLSEKGFEKLVNTDYMAKMNTRAVRQARLSMSSPSRHSPPAPIAALETRTLIKHRISSGEKVLNKYIIKKELGRGVSGRVYLAQDVETGKLFAIKALQKTLVSYLTLTRDDLQSALQREIAIMKKLHHVNVVALIEVIDDPSSQKIYLVQEYVARGNLMTVLTSEHPIGEEKARHYMCELIKGLRYLHFQKVIHRDLKPENLLVTDADILKIADFGASDMFNNETETFSDAKGTPAFMAPELFEDSLAYVGPAADIWSVGATLYMLLFNRPPWNGQNEIELSRAIQQNEIEFPNDVNIGPHLRNLLLRLLTKNPSRRITMEELLEHPWITQEGSCPIQDETYEVLTATAQEEEESIRAIPKRINVEYLVALDAASLMVSPNLVSVSSMSCILSSDAPTQLLANWRHRMRVQLVNEHSELSDRGRDLLLEQRRVAFSSDRAIVTELVLEENQNELTSSLHDESPFPPPRTKLSRKKDFLMVTSEVLRDRSTGTIQKRKVVFEARDGAFSLAAGVRSEEVSNLAIQSSLTEMTSEGHKSKRRTSLKKDASLDDDLSFVDVIIESDDDGDDVSDDSSTYSEVDEDIDMDETFDALARSSHVSLCDDECDFMEEKFPSENHWRNSLLDDNDVLSFNYTLGIVCARSESMGKRVHMEDRSIAILQMPESVDAPVAFFAIYDGHSGHQTSSLLHDHFHHVVYARFKDPSRNSVVEALTNACVEMDHRCCTDVRIEEVCEKQLHKYSQSSGSTAVFVLIEQCSEQLTRQDIVSEDKQSGIGLQMHVGNVGDCRAVLCQGGIAVDVTTDHKAVSTPEHIRITAAGGYVHNGRLNGVLAVSRAFGDVAHKVDGQLIVTPDVYSHVIGPYDEFLLLASDGLFDVMTSQVAINYIRRQCLLGTRTLTDICNALIEKALTMHACDNVSAMIIGFNTTFNISKSTENQNATTIF